VPGLKAWELSLPLCLTAAVYARTGRLVFAEGLLREAAKRLHLAVDSASDAAPSGPWRTDMHPSIPACIAWQFAQVCTATVKRSTEAEQWARVAQHLWPYPHELSSHLGPRSVLGAPASNPHVLCMSFIMARVFHRAA
jgi:hypothetical protein